MDLVGRKVLIRTFFRELEGEIVFDKQQLGGEIVFDKQQESQVYLQIKFEDYFGVLGKEVDFRIVGKEVDEFYSGKIASTVSGMNTIQLLGNSAEDEYSELREHYQNWHGAKNYFTKQELDAIKASLNYIVNKEDFSSETNKLLFERTIKKVKGLYK